MASGEPCQWDAVCGCWRDASGAEWDRLAEKAEAERVARAVQRIEEERAARAQVAAEAQAKQEEKERNEAECFRLRLQKSELQLQKHMREGELRRAEKRARTCARLAKLQESDAAHNATAGRVAVACSVTAEAEQNPEWLRIQRTYRWDCIPRGVPEWLPARVRFRMEIFRVGAHQDPASEPKVLHLNEHTSRIGLARWRGVPDCGCGEGVRCKANEAKRLGHAPIASWTMCGRNEGLTKREWDTRKCQRNGCWDAFTASQPP